jgi:DNA-binding transcriptional ArsR family regulator
VTESVAPSVDRVESIRLALANAWGEMGASWGVAPAIARVHAYLMARGEPLTEREVREALGLSHRAASLALESALGWGIVETVAEPRRVGRRKTLEGDPIVAVLERTLQEAEAVARAEPGNAGARALRDWLATFLAFVRVFDRAIGLVPAVEPARLRHVLDLLAKVPDPTILRLVDLLEELPDEDVLTLVNGLARMRPGTARRATKLMVGVIRTVGR